MTKQRISPDDGDPRHGTTNGYSNLGCRCQPCRNAHTVEFQAAKKRRQAKIIEGTSTVKHGLASTYFNHGCRCESCKAARLASDRLRRRL